MANLNLKGLLFCIQSVYPAHSTPITEVNSNLSSYDYKTLAWVWLRHRVMNVLAYKSSWRIFSGKMASSSRFPMISCNILCLISDSTKTIRLLALDVYEVIVDEGFALINYHLIEIS